MHVLPLGVLAFHIDPIEIAIVGEDDIIMADDHGCSVFYALLVEGIEFDDLFGVQVADGIGHDAIPHQHIDCSVVGGDVEDGLGRFDVDFIELFLLGRRLLVVDGHSHRLKHFGFDGRIWMEN